MFLSQFILGQLEQEADDVVGTFTHPLDGLSRLSGTTPSHLLVNLSTDIGPPPPTAYSLLFIAL